MVLLRRAVPCRAVPAVQCRASSEPVRFSEAGVPSQEEAVLLEWAARSGGRSRSATNTAEMARDASVSARGATVATATAIGPLVLGPAVVPSIPVAGVAARARQQSGSVGLMPPGKQSL